MVCNLITPPCPPLTLRGGTIKISPLKVRGVRGVMSVKIYDYKLPAQG